MPALTTFQPFHVVGLVVSDKALLAAPYLPVRCLAVGAGQVSAGQCLVDATPDRVLRFRLDGEQGSDTHLVPDPIGPAVVRRERTRRFVVPVPTQSHGDRRARSLLIGEPVHGQNDLVRERFPHNGKLNLPTGVVVVRAIAATREHMPRLGGVRFTIKLRDDPGA